MASGYAITTLVVFIVSTFFVVCPVSIPTPRPLPRIPINLTTAPILAIVLLWTARCIDSAVIRDGIIGTEGVKPYNILILFLSWAYMATTLDITGIFQAAAFWVSNKGGHNGWKIYLYFYVMLTLLSIPLGGDVVVFFATGFLVYYSQVAELEPRAWIMAEFAAVNTASMVLFVGNPTNVVICEGFSVNNAAFTAHTILPFLACNLFCLVTLAFQYRRQVPRRLTRVARLDPRLALLDPVGALVGSCMLVATLILCLVVSFLRIDVWMIALPFAVGKLMFDLGWDHYRHSRGIPMLGRGLPTVIRELGEGLAVDKGERTDQASVYSPSLDEERLQSPFSSETIRVQSRSDVLGVTPQPEPQPSPAAERTIDVSCMFRRFRSNMNNLLDRLDKHFPTFIVALPRLPLVLMPFAFSQFILVEALDHQGWVDVFADWLIRASGKRLHPTIWLIGVIGVIFCNLTGTNVGAAVLLTKIVRAADLSYDSNHGAAITLAVVSNIGAVGFTFSASFTGLFWKTILAQKGVHMTHRGFARWNLLPLLVMTTIGLGTVSAEMEVLSTLVMMHSRYDTVDVLRLGSVVQCIIDLILSPSQFMIGYLLT